MLKAISLFSGVGGLDFGFEAAGYRTTVAVEMDAKACSTIRLNRDWPVLEGDINDISSDDILQTAQLGVGDADVLIGGPPCQPFSKSGYWVHGDTRRLDDPRADTLTAYLRVLRDTQPKAFLIENVSGLVYKKKDEGLQYILDGISEINRETGSNYSIQWKVLNSAEYGVPQIRERVFLIGSREGHKFRFPQQTHRTPKSKTASLTEDLQPCRTAWDAIGDLPEPTTLDSLMVGGKWGDLLPSIPEGQNYLWHTNRGGGSSLFGWRTRYWSFMLKLSKRLPSWTIQAQPGASIGPFHWNNRKLTPQEMCRLQTFPDGIQFNCGRTEIQRMIGNAVPSLLTEILGREIKEQFLRGSTTGPLTLLPPKRNHVPQPKPVEPLAEKYYELIGDYADHPGTRKKSIKVPDKAARDTLPLLRQAN